MATIVMALRIFALSVMAIYGAGVIISHLNYSSDERTACHSAGGIMGRIWCPDSVDTAGFQHYFVKALGWPAHVARTPATAANTLDKTVTPLEAGDEAVSTQQRAERAQASVSEVQGLLHTLGYRVGVADGIAGPLTLAAISEFQLRDGMQVSGMVSEELIARLKNSVQASLLSAVSNR